MKYYVISALTAYLMGSISPSVILGNYVFGRDPRKYGSHNPGATNSIYVNGFLGGLIVMLFDIMKGYTAVWIAERFFSGQVEEPLTLLIGAAFFAVLGHNRSIFLKFQGGKGFATFTGIIIYLFPTSILILVPLFGIVLWTTKYVSVAALFVVTVSTAIQLWNFAHDHAVGIKPSLFLAAIWVLILFDHRENFVRLAKGQETSIRTPRISDKELDGE